MLRVAYKDEGNLNKSKRTIITKVSVSGFMVGRGALKVFTVYHFLNWYGGYLSVCFIALCVLWSLLYVYFISSQEKVRRNKDGCL